MGNCIFPPIRETKSYEYVILQLKNGKVYARRSGHLYRDYREACKAGFAEGDHIKQPLTITLYENRSDIVRQIDTLPRSRRAVPRLAVKVASAVNRA